jgi:hypothetical protein
MSRNCEGFVQGNMISDHHTNDGADTNISQAIRRPSQKSPIWEAFVPRIAVSMNDSGNPALIIYFGYGGVYTVSFGALVKKFVFWCCGPASSHAVCGPQNLDLSTRFPYDIPFAEARVGAAGTLHESSRFFIFGACLFLRALFEK